MIKGLRVKKKTKIVVQQTIRKSNEQAVADPGFQIRGGPGQVHSLDSKNIYTKFSKYFYNAEKKTQYN